MPKFEKKIITDVSESAQDSEAPIATVQNNTVAAAPKTVEEYLAQFRANDEDYVATSLRFKDGFDEKPWTFHGFRYDAVGKWLRIIKNDGWVQVQKDGGIYGQSFQDWFEDDVWDDDGNLTDYPVIEKGSARKFSEIIWFVRPAAASKARQIVEAEHSGNYVNGRHSEKKAGGWAGERQGMVRIDEYEIGDEGGNGW